MKKRLMALLLCLVMVLSVVLVGCSKDDDVEGGITEKGSQNARSLTMWVVSEKEVDAETASAVNDALNTITRSKFKTNLVVNFLTKEQYRSTVSATVRAYEDSKNYLLTGNTAEVETSAETETYVEETVTNEFGQVTTKFPELNANQVDIIFIDGYDMYNEYIANGWLVALDSELSASSKKIKEYISSTLLSAAKLNGATYAIPNNNTIGEYTYMLLDKELMNETFMNGKLGEINGMFNDYIFSYLETVRQHHTDVIPVAASYEDCLDLLAHYWSINPETYDAEQMAFSFLGYRYTDPTTLSKGQTVLSFNSLFADEVFCENFAKLNEYRLDGQYFFADEANTEKRAAIRFCKGDLSDYQKYEEGDDYYPVIVKYPSVNIEDVYTNMFGVCKYSVDSARSMQIVTYLTSNADFRNILQYGVEGVHYELVEKDGKTTVERLNENYMMDIFKTGNAFIAYPEPTMDKNIWEVGKQQNRQAKIEPLLNFDFAQIAKNSGDAASATLNLGTKSYVYEFTTGYAKEVLSENALLNKWFQECDAAGKGVYVLHTSLLSGQNLTGKIYYYNNNITNASVTMNDADQNVSVNYSGTVGNGYEITVINFYGKKNSSILNWKATVNGSDAATKVTYQNSVLNFDLLHTEHYSVDLTTGLTKAGVVDNDAVWAWLDACPNTGAHVATYSKTANGKTVYTYVFYENGSDSSVTVQPTGNGGALRVAINYTKQGSDSKYALFLITVTADEGTTVTFDLKRNGEAFNAAATEFAEDPMFRKCGKLDTELVNYVYSINQQVMKLINECTTIEELRAVINDLHILFTPITKQPHYEQIPGVRPRLTNDAVKAFADTLDLEEFYWFLYSATSSSAVTHKDYNESGEKLEDVKNEPNSGEAYVYYSSPYMLYYAWLKSNGFVK